MSGDQPSNLKNNIPDFDNNLCRFGCSPSDWFTFCPYVRPESELPGTEYDVWSDDYTGSSSVCTSKALGYGDDRGGFFYFGYPSAFGRPRIDCYSPWLNDGTPFSQPDDCLTSYRQLNTYEKVQNKDYNFTIKGKNNE